MFWNADWCYFRCGNNLQPWRRFSTDRVVTSAKGQGRMVAQLPRCMRYCLRLNCLDAQPWVLSLIKGISSMFIAVDDLELRKNTIDQTLSNHRQPKVNTCLARTYNVIKRFVTLRVQNKEHIRNDAKNTKSCLSFAMGRGGGSDAYIFYRRPELCQWDRYMPPSTCSCQTLTEEPLSSTHTPSSHIVLYRRAIRGDVGGKFTHLLISLGFSH